MNEPDTIRVFINPIQFLEVDEPWATFTNTTLVAEDFFRFLCAPGTSSDIPSMASRYKEVSQETKRLFAAPHDHRILQKLVWPLRHAKASFILGNYLSTIALCGLVSEMMALFLFELTVIDGAEIRSDKGAIMNSSSFESTGQKERVRALWKSGSIADDLKDDFDFVRTTRRKYLHRWSQDHDRLQQDSQKVFHTTVELVVKSFGFGVNKGKVVFKPSIIMFLKKTGSLL